MRHSSPPNQKPGISRFHQELVQFGINVEPLYQQLDLDESVMSADNTSIDFIKYLQLLELASVTSKHRFLGIELALKNRNDNLGLLTYILRNASTFKNAIELLNRYVILVSPDTYTALIEQKEQCVLTYQLNTPSPVDCKQDIEGTIAQFIEMVRVLLQDDEWNPIDIYFQHDAPDKSELENLPLQARVTFNHIFNGISFDKKLLEMAVENHDPKLLALLEIQAKTEADNLIQNDSFIYQVKLLISSKLGDQDATADTVATELGMSRRTLNRRLSEMNTTFNNEREDIVYQLAKQSLLNSSISVTELAQELGYSDSSAFNRAFKRLSGKTPREYRNSLRNIS